MAEAEQVLTTLPRPLPEQRGRAETLTPNEMRALKARDRPAAVASCSAATTNDMDLAPDRIQAMVWVALRRAGHDVDVGRGRVTCCPT